MGSTIRGDGSLKRQLNPMNVWAIAFGCVIGWGSFINPGKKFLSNSGVAGTAIAMTSLCIIWAVSFIEHDHMSAADAFFLIELCIIRGIHFGNEVFLRLIPGIPKGAADDLLDRAVMNIDTWAKFHAFSLEIRH